MTGVILAAGRGRRLSAVTGDAPKCLARLGGRTLLARQIELLRHEGVRQIVVVVGHGAAAVGQEAGPGVTLVQNARHAVTNSLYSLWLARHLLGGGFVVLNCDVLCHRQLLTDLLTSRHEDALLYAPQLPDQHYSEEEMKVAVRRGRVVALSKELDAAATDGENVGIARFGPEGASVLIEELSRHSSEGERAWLPAAFSTFAVRRPLFAVPTRGYPWIEIDSPDDYWRACSEVLPAVDAARLPATAVADAGLRRPLHHV